MPATINPGAIGMSSYTVSDSVNAWFYLDVDLDAGEEASFEINAPGAAVTLLEGATTLGTISGAPFANDNGTRQIAANAGGGLISLTVTALNPYTATLTVRGGAIPPGNACALTETGGGGLIRRILADPVANAPAPASPIFEHTPIALSGTARYTTVPVPGPAPAGTPDPPVLRARWAQQGPTTIAAPPPATIFSQSVAVVAPLAANPAPFNAPGVHTTAALAYRLTAFYDPNLNNTADAGEPTATADVTLTVKERTHHMLLVVDRSGSMTATMPGTVPPITRWEFARRAAHVWADLWIALRGGVSAADRAGIMIFEAQNCGWTGATAGPLDILLPAGNLGNVGGLGVVDLNLGGPGACTPIGDALLQAMTNFANLNPAPTPDDRFVILLLTDGYENSGKIVVEEDSPVPAGATANFRTARTGGPLASINQRLAIYTAGLGSPGTVQESALEDLTDESGSASVERGLYRLVQANLLMSTFGEMLGHAVEAQPIPLGVNATFPVSANEERLAIAVAWESVTDELKVHRQVSSAAEQQVAGPGAIATAGITYDKRGKHAIVSVDLPAHLGTPVPATTWRVEYLKNGTTPQAIAAGNFLALVDLAVKATISFDRRRYFTGGRAQVTCQLQAGAEPITDARVWVQLARPGEGLGTFLGTNGPRYKPTQPGGKDPAAAKAAMVQQLLKLTDRQELPIVTPARIFRDGTDELWDDGQHRDGAVDDGVYSNLYLDLDKEGTYTWRFIIEGKTPDGEPFARIVTKAFWVGVRPDPDPKRTTIDVNRDIRQPDGQLAAQIIVRPADRNGELLGPFRASQVAITCSEGQFDPLGASFAAQGVVYPQPDKGSLLSHYDGRYSRILVYKKGTHPKVSVAIQGREFVTFAL